MIFGGSLLGQLPEAESPAVTETDELSMKVEA
jgi:hypothetical protein